MLYPCEELRVICRTPCITPRICVNRFSSLFLPFFPFFSILDSEPGEVWKRRSSVRRLYDWVSAPVRFAALGRRGFQAGLVEESLSILAGACNAPP